jgi:hypothetical protein
MSNTIESIFEKAGLAIIKGKSKVLARAVNEMITLTRMDASLMEALFAAAKHLAKSKGYLPQAAIAFLHVTKNVPSTGVLKQRTIASLADCGDALSSLADREEAFRRIIDNASPGSALEQKAVEGYIRYINALPSNLRAALTLEAALSARSDSFFERRMEETFIKRVEAFPKASDRVAAYGYAAQQAAAGSAFEQKIIKKFMRHADALPTTIQRISAYRVAASEAPSESALAHEAAEGFIRHIETLPTAAQRVRALLHTSHHTVLEVLARPVLLGIMRHAEALPTVAGRVGAFREAAELAPLTAPDSALERQAVAKFVKHVETLPTLAQRMAAYQSVLETSAADTPLGRQATAKLRELEIASPPPLIRASSRGA